jgi:hypothetical protein
VERDREQVGPTGQGGGAARRLGLGHDQAADDHELGDADGGDEHDQARALEQAGEERLLDEATQGRGRGERDQQGQPVVEVGVAGEGQHHRHRERTELAVGEVDDAVGHVDEDEARRQQGVGHADHQAEGDQVH